MYRNMAKGKPIKVAETIDLSQSAKAPNTSPTAPATATSKSPTSNLRRDIDEKDLKNPAIGRMLLGQIDTCQQEIQELKEYKEKYHNANTLASVLQERLERLENSLTAKSLFSTIGGIVAGALPSIYGTPQYFWPAIFLAVVFIVIGTVRIDNVFSALIKWLASKV